MMENRCLGKACLNYEKASLALGIRKLELLSNFKQCFSANSRGCF